jgi:3-phenylpropionate/trans-cinnamate dioxygenase ferredoxin subunit
MILADLRPLWGVVGVLELASDDVVLRFPAGTDPTKLQAVACWVGSVLLPGVEIKATVDTELASVSEEASYPSEEPVELYYPDITQPFVIERSRQPVVQRATEVPLKNDPAWYPIDGIRVQDLLEDSVTSVSVADRIVTLVKRRGSIHAFQGTCPHQGSLLGPGVLTRDGCIVCPLHKWEFCGETGRSPGGHDVGLTSFEVDVRNEQIWVLLPISDGEIKNAESKRGVHE